MKNKLVDISHLRNEGRYGGRREKGRKMASQNEGNDDEEYSTLLSKWNKGATKKVET